MSTVKKKAIIFDLYGVLALNGWQAFKAKHFSDREHIWDAVYELGKKVDAGIADYKELVRFTARQTGESEATVRYQLEHTLANDELLEYIEHAALGSHYKLAIVSNGGNLNVLHRFTPAQRRLFSAVVFSRDVGYLKPQRDIFQIVADKLGVSLEDCVFVDDQKSHVLGARSAGMEGVVYTSVTKLKRELTRLL
jgi:putative hydrolase of the HAD superfamily